MTTADNGGAAFPVSWDELDRRSPGWIGGGLSIRDYFAARAMQGMLSDSEFEQTPEVTARLCYRLADAMLAERAK